MAIAFGLSVPMIGVSSLDLLAFPVRHTRRLIAATIDARRGELFTAFYRQVPGGVQRVSEPQVVTPDDLYGELQAASTECLVVGDGALRYRDMLEGLTKVEIADESLAYPSASSLVALAHARALREEFVQPTEIKPLYLRRPDAEINWQTRPAQ
jgi:tRNA threonylcarbamoyladenosine biosynthesis protein TsaB